MASTLVSSGDLLHEIFQYCPRQDIANLRQCSRQFETIASDYLFTTLTVGFRKRYTRRLKRVAACEKFSKSVREIVGESASYQKDDRPYELSLIP